MRGSDLHTLEGLKRQTREADPWDGPRPDLGKCWEAIGGRRCRFGYVRIDLRFKGLEWASRRITSHVLTWILNHLGPMGRDELFLAYHEFRASGLQIDHRCENPACRRPSHLQAVTQRENIAATKERRYQRQLARGDDFEAEHDPAEVEF